MPKNGTIDIPHVTTTDHFIRKPVEKSDVKKVKEFLGLACINNSNPDSISTGNAFISYYEKFSSNPSYLDSALKYFKSDNKEDINKNFNELIRLYYLKNDFGKVIEYANAIPDKLNSFKSSVMNDDAWTAYRIGEAFNAKSDALNTLKYYRKATELAKYQLDFRNKLAGAELDNGLTEEAISNYRFILKENPEYASAYVSLGYALLLQNRDHATADSLYDKALSLDPDNIQAFMNKAAIRLMIGENLQAKKFLQEVLKRDKSNVLALRILKQIK
jgi:tetratricopeptide (TPR) repeat protein